MFIKALRLTRGRKCLVVLLPDNPHELVSDYVRDDFPEDEARPFLTNLMNRHRVGAKFRDVNVGSMDRVRVIALYAYLRGYDFGIKIERILLTAS